MRGKSRKIYIICFGLLGLGKQLVRTQERATDQNKRMELQCMSRQKRNNHCGEDSLDSVLKVEETGQK